MAFACRGCQLEQEMRMIPASYLPQSVRTELSKVLDPPRDLKDNDYRYFAARNRLTPMDVQWLDSQKTQWRTSSIGLVLDYLINQLKDCFTVYTVYKTLCEMKSDGQRIICEGMPEIRRLYNRGTRPGQEHTEPLSVDSPPQPPPAVQRPEEVPSPPVQRSLSPPPPYQNLPSQQSLHMSLAGGDGAHALNNLNDGYQQPANDSGANFHGGQVSAACERSFPSDCDTECRGSPRVQGRRTNPCEVSFPSSTDSNRLKNLQPCRREAGESSYHSDFTSDGNTLSVSPPSYLESQLQYGSSQNQIGTPQEPLTRMQDLKLPLEGPVVTPAGCPGPRLEWNVQASPDTHLYQNKPAPPQPVCPPNRPTSFPQTKPASDSIRHQLTRAKRPYSDKYCSHTGACSCLAEQHAVFTEEGFSPLSSDTDEMSDLSSRGEPWKESLHQTDVKLPLTGGICAGLQGPNSLNKLQSSAQSPYHSAPALQQYGGLHTSATNRLTSRFVFVMAADITETERLDQQVSAVCEQLQAYGICYVVVRSTNLWPVHNLPARILRYLPELGDSQSVGSFVRSCFRKASKVLMLVTPGYLPYADDYSKHAGKEETYQQKLIRQLQEELKAEFFEKKREFRIWPVLLHEMKANDTHIPSLLRSSVYYWFPHYEDVENVMTVLKEDLTMRSSKVKRSI